MASENSFSHRQHEIWWECHDSEEDNSTSTSEDDDVLEGFLEELNVKGHELLKKLAAKVENEEELFREMWHHFGRKHASRILEKIARKIGKERNGGLMRRERGVDGYDSEGDMKNERFKVKTNANVIKEEVAT